MKRPILILLLGTCTGTVLAGPESLSTCSEGRRPDIRWSPAGSDTVACHQTVLGAWISGAPGSSREKMAAFSHNILTAIRPADLPNPAPLYAPQYQPGDWLETGSTGVPGELWWGRTAHQHIAVGQESHLRLAKANERLPASVRPALQDFLMRRMMAMVQKQPMVNKPGDERFKVFPRAAMDYRQHAATLATFDRGLGGNGNIVPGRVANARLDLQTTPVIKGMLRFDLAVDGDVRQFAIPVRAASEQEPLRATLSGADHAGECNTDLAAYNVAPRSSCIIPNGAAFTEAYDATGAFFGERGSLAAVHFRLRVNSPPRNRTGAIATGLIVLKAQ